ncbi:MAG TPA: hypothetical protein GXX40_01300 [Firmicutes bacterium]|nr:hypothetical protein [Bacillota bacterium]
MRKHALVVLVGLATVLVLAFGLQIEVLTDYAKHEYFLGNWGAGQGEFGLVTGTDGNTYGPLCFAVGVDGRVVVPDVANKRLVVVSRNSDGTISHASLNLSGKKQVTNIEILEDGSICYVGASQTALTVIPPNGGEREISFPKGALGDVCSVDAMWSSGENVLWVLDSLVTESGLQRRLWRVDVASGKSILALKSDTHDQTAVRTAVPGRDGSALVEVGIGAPSQRRIVVINAEAKRTAELVLPNLDEFTQVRLLGGDRQGCLYFYCAGVDKTPRIRKVTQGGALVRDFVLNGRARELMPVVLKVYQDGSIYMLEPRKEGLYLLVQNAVTRRRVSLRRLNG